MTRTHKAQEATPKPLYGVLGQKTCADASAASDAPTADSGAFVVHLPLAPRECWPNRSRRLHWRLLYAAQQEAKGWAYVAAIAALATPEGTRMPRWTRCRVTLTFVWPDKRTRDLDGALSACKPYLDSLTAAGVWVDDSAIVELTMRAEVDKARAGVVIEVQEVT